MKTSLKGIDLLRAPLYNKGTAFTSKEREIFQLEGLLPHHVSSIEEQVERRYKNFKSKFSSMGKYQFLSALQDRNEVLFYRLVYEHIEEMMPYVYTPTVGEASLDYSLYYNESRGLYVPYDLRDRMDQIFDNIRGEEIDLIVVTDGGRILGLGDLGVGGMTIPIGKLNLYILFGGISPYRVLPILLDVGTDNPALLENPLYLGLRHKRVDGEEYDRFLDQFVDTVKRKCPNALLQWEDFPGKHAFHILQRYQDRLCSFNDDIQGTAAVSLAAILSGVKAAKRKVIKEKIAILGAGSAGMGIASLIADFYESEGVCREKAYENIYILDRDGLIQSHSSKMTEQQKPFSKNPQELKGWKVQKSDAITLEEVIENAKITTLIGVSTKAGAFDEKIVSKMSLNTDLPIFLPLSNPTKNSEAIPKDIIKWTNGKAMIATGSPFSPVCYQGEKRIISQCNNVMIFPAIGLAAIAMKMTHIDKTSFLVAAKTLSEHSPSLICKEYPLLPELYQLRGIIKKMAIAIAEDAIQREIIHKPTEKLEKIIESFMWFPEYSSLEIN